MSFHMSYEDFLTALKTDMIPEDRTFKRESCPIDLFVVLQGKWKNHVLFEVCRHDAVRFSQLKKALPEITNTMLTATLRELEEYGLISRQQFNEIPPHVEYSLTESGKGLMPIYYEMFLWGLKHKINNK